MVSVRKADTFILLPNGDEFPVKRSLVIEQAPGEIKRLMKIAAAVVIGTGVWMALPTGKSSTEQAPITSVATQKMPIAPASDRGRLTELAREASNLAFDSRPLPYITHSDKEGLTRLFDAASQEFGSGSVEQPSLRPTFAGIDPGMLAP